MEFEYLGKELATDERIGGKDCRLRYLPGWDSSVKRRREFSDQNAGERIGR